MLTFFDSFIHYFTIIIPCMILGAAVTLLGVRRYYRDEVKRFEKLLEDEHKQLRRFRQLFHDLLFKDKNDAASKIANAILGEYRKNYPDHTLTGSEIVEIVRACTEFTDIVKDLDVIAKVADSVGKNNDLCHFEDVATLHPDANARDATHREIKEILEGIAFEADNGKHTGLSPQDLADKVLTGDLAKYYFKF